ncbi:MAG: four helix bundle protein [Aggregatilineales bacterium]
MQDFKTLVVWQKAHQLVLDVYRASRQFPADELYGLTSQIRRSSSSIPTNIAEGCGRGSNADLRRFLQIAMGSAFELEYQILLAYDLEYLDKMLFDKLSEQTIEVKKMLTGFIKSLR